MTLLIISQKITQRHIRKVFMDRLYKYVLMAMILQYSSLKGCDVSFISPLLCSTLLLLPLCTVIISLNLRNLLLLLAKIISQPFQKCISRRVPL